MSVTRFPSLAFFSAAIGAATILIAHAPAEARGRHAHSHSSHMTMTDGDEPVRGCGDIHVRFDDLEMARSEEQLTISRKDAQGLRVVAARNGGVHVQGSDRSDYLVTACKTAAGRSGDVARRSLADIALSFEGGRLTVRGPSGERWEATLVIQAPRDADISVESTNGPIGLADLSGKTEGHVVNGPISLLRCGGSVKVDAVNGPISVFGGSGELEARGENGPLTVVLDDTRWEGTGLTGRTTNGPVTLRVASGFQSAILVQGSAHSPMRCQGDDCRDARRNFTDDDDDDDDRDNRSRTIEIGRGNPVVQLSTTNGPVSVERTRS